MRNSIKHTFISWDCSYRHFFHTIDGLLNQDFDRSKFELIYIEQRSREYSQNLADKRGVKSLWDRYQETKDEFNVRVIYLGEELTEPYHLGRTVNEALERAQGKLISVMDGDLLLPSSFLDKLDKYHIHNQDSIVNLKRYMAQRPVGVDKDEWKDQDISYRKVLSVCEGTDNKIPESVNNKGPLISAPRCLWERVEGYDEHKIWSTGVSRLGQDVTARLEVASGNSSIALPDCFAVHPWHPQGFARNTINHQKLLNVHSKLIQRAKDNEISNWQERLEFTKQLYEENKRFVDKVIYSDLGRPEKSNIDRGSMVVKIQRLMGSLYRKSKAILNKLLGLVY